MTRTWDAALELAALTAGMPPRRGIGVAGFQMFALLDYPSTLFPINR